MASRFTPTTKGVLAPIRIQAGGRELVLDSVTGTALSLTELATGFDWLEQPGPHRFGGVESGKQLEVFFSIWEPSDPVPVTLMAEEAGPLFRRIVVIGPAGEPIREYRLFEGENRIDFTAALDRSKLPHVPFDDHSRHYGVAFTAHLDLPTVLTVDGPDGFYQPGSDSLAGAALGHFAAATGAILEGASGRWMAVSSRDTPIVNLGEMTGAPAASIETDEYALNWKLIRHHSQGQVKGGAIVDIDPEPGMDEPIHFLFPVRFGEAADPKPDRFELHWDLSPPLVTWAQGAADSGLPASGTWFQLQGPAVLTAMKMSRSGEGAILRIRGGETGGTAELILPRAPESVWLTDLVERPQRQLSLTGRTVAIPLVANGVVTILVKP